MLDPVKDIIRTIGLPDPALHVLVGLAIFLLSTAVLRSTWSNWKPWLVVLGLQLLNEVADAAKDVLDGYAIGWRGGLLDTVLTIALPTLLVLLAKQRRGSIRH